MIIIERITGGKQLPRLPDGCLRVMWEDENIIKVVDFDPGPTHDCIKMMAERYLERKLKNE